MQTKCFNVQNVVEKTTEKLRIKVLMSQEKSKSRIKHVKALGHKDHGRIGNKSRRDVPTDAGLKQSASMSV